MWNDIVTVDILDDCSWEYRAKDGRWVNSNAFGQGIFITDSLWSQRRAKVDVNYVPQGSPLVVKTSVCTTNTNSAYFLKIQFLDEESNIVDTMTGIICI